MNASKLKIGVVLNFKSAEKKKDELINIKDTKRSWLSNKIVDPKHIIIKGKSKYVADDVATGYFMQQILGADVDFIEPDEITIKRFKSNDIVFVLIYDLLEAYHLAGPKKYEEYKKILKKSPNVYPPYEYQKFINNKCTYYKYLEKKGIPIAPTYCITGDKLLKKDYVKKLITKLRSENKWEDFIAKPVLGQESKDFAKFKGCPNLNCHEKKLKNYLSKAVPKYKSIILQEYIKGFDKDNPELRMFFIGGEYRYTIVTTSNDVYKPKQEGGKKTVKYFNEAKQLAKKVMSVIPKIYIGNKGQPSVVTRIDIGTGLEGSKGGFFINELEFVPSLYSEENPTYKGKPFLPDQQIGTEFYKVALAYSKS
jgi:hypothetical protein